MRQNDLITDVFFYLPTASIWNKKLAYHWVYSKQNTHVHVQIHMCRGVCSWVHMYVKVRGQSGVSFFNDKLGWLANEPISAITHL